MSSTLKVALAQISPVWLNKRLTIQKIISYIDQGAKDGAELIVFGESILPGYPYWLSYTGGASFNSRVQKEIHSHYIQNAIQIESGDLNSICAMAKDHKIAIYLGTIERAADRGGHSLYCSLIYIDQEGSIQSVHRKLQPTYEERLTWSPGDGNGLRVHALKDFRLGGLNCWENWMPLPRAALYGLGENVHVAVWPGSLRNTIDTAPFIAKESRSYSIAVSGLMRKEDVPEDTPHYDLMMEHMPDSMSDGGSCIANPDGSWLIEPIVNKEGIFVADLNFNRILEERQNLDPAGHYSRPDVTKLILNRERQSTLEIKE
ncbi:MAG: nitrilase [Saprospiraceae bacterium]|jgi:nitrilase